METVLIVGAGHAAGELATSLRQGGFEGRIVMVGAENHLPYQRPPLSKAYLSGEVQAEALYLKPQTTYDKAGVEFIGSTLVEAINRSTKTVTLSDERTLRYDKLALTTGGRVRRLSIAGAKEAEGSNNFHYLRTIEDVRRISPQFQAGKRLVIIGGGYVGLEVAAVAIKRQLHVTVLEGAPRVLARVTAPVMSAFYEQVHREAGVELHTGVAVEGIELTPTGDAVTAVLCSSGLRIPADLVIVGIGLLPNVELAEIAGLVVDNGIVVDEFAQTSDPDIVSAGDCTNHPNPILGRRIRLESVPNALEQARTAAATICGKHRPHNSMPWFWSDQYDLKLQMVGLSEGYDQVVLRGDPAKRSFIAFYLKDGNVIAADSVSRPVEFMSCKRLVTERAEVAPSVLADESVPLKSLFALPAV
ncbi:NAD(P)/FAD-dependent oxidoreductase [Pseudomonas sp. BF-R-19]|uniref:NAD(P)/FAD-dependent oxidoreductase n=1 Tax=Pseudomonas sp. BF-R-19 TaxID=2832397 RepID=UPI003988C96D